GRDGGTEAYLGTAGGVAEGLVSRERLPAAKMRVVHNGIDLSRLPAFSLERQEARRAAGFDPRRRLVAQVGRLALQKDYPTFLTAAARVAAQAPDVDFLIVGEGELRAELAATASPLGLDG